VGPASQRYSSSIRGQIEDGRPLGLCEAINASCAWAEAPSCASQVPPSEQLGELFQQVQLKRIFPDSKTFVDLHSDEPPSAILADYQVHKDASGFDLSAFVHRHFSMAPEGPDVRPALPGEALERYVGRLWDILRHESNETADRSSLLPLPYRSARPEDWSHFLEMAQTWEVLAKQHDHPRRSTADRGEYRRTAQPVMRGLNQHPLM
jgi:neutral trehalase